MRQETRLCERSTLTDFLVAKPIVKRQTPFALNPPFLNQFLSPVAVITWLALSVRAARDHNVAYLVAENTE